MSDNSARHVTITTEEDLKKKEPRKKTAPKKSPKQGDTAEKTEAKSPNLPADDSIIGKTCPICGQGTIIKGKTAYGCSNWKGGCQFRLPFSQQ